MKADLKNILASAEIPVIGRKTWYGTHSKKRQKAQQSSSQLLNPAN